MSTVLVRAERPLLGMHAKPVSGSLKVLSSKPASGGHHCNIVAVVVVVVVVIVVVFLLL